MKGQILFFWMTEKDKFWKIKHMYFFLEKIFLKQS